MERSGKIPLFDGRDFSYWKVRMEAYLLSQGSAIWEIVDSNYEIPTARTAQDQIEQYEANNKARNILFTCLSRNEFDRVQHLRTAREIWSTLSVFHEGTNQIKARRQSTYNQEFQMFVQGPGESLDAMFARFDGIVSNLRSTGVLPYSDHERAIKLLYALDRSIWEVKISSIEESPSYDTLTCDELFSKLKSTEIAKAARISLGNPLSQNMALVSGSGGGNQSTAGFSCANMSSSGFALSSLVSVTEEQVDALDDEDLALIVKKFTRFYNNRRDHRRGGSRACFECGDTTHFKADCPKLKKREDGDHDYNKHKKKNKKPFSKKNRDKMAKKAAKAASRAFVAALSDIDTSSCEEDSSEEDEPQAKNKKKAKDFTGLCFMADDHNDDSDPELDPSEVLPSYDQLSIQVDTLNDALVSQDRLLKKAVRELKDLRPKYESASAELALLRSRLDVEECESCLIVMAELAELRNVHAQVASRLESAEKKLLEEESRSTLLGACINCPLLVKDVDLKEKRLKELESRLESAGSSKDVQPNCSTCTIFQDKLSWVREQVQKLLTENEYLLSLVEKCSEGKGKMNLILAKTKMCADKAGLALGLGFERVAYNGESKTVFTTPTTLDAEKSKINTTPQPIKKPTPQPKMREFVRKPRVTDNRVPERRYHCTYCQRDGHLVGFCFRRRRDERCGWDWSTRDMYRPSIGVHESFPRFHSRVPSAFQSFPKGVARRGFYHNSYGFGPRVRGYESQGFDGPRFPYRGTRPQRVGVELPTVSTSGRMTQYWIPRRFLTNPSTEPSTFYSSHM